MHGANVFVRTHTINNLNQCLHVALHDHSGMFGNAKIAL